MVSQFGSPGYTIMGKTADLRVVQKTTMDTLHKEGKPQTFIAKEAGCSQSAVSKHVNRKLSGRKKCGRKRCTSNRENRSLLRIVKQNLFKNLGELHKKWTEAGVKASRATKHRCLLVLVHCVFWKPTSLHPFTKKFEHFMLPYADQLFKDHFPAGFGSCTHCQKHQKLVKWPWCWCAWLASKLTRPEPRRESIGYCQKENEKQEAKKYRWAEGHCQRNLGFHTTSAVPHTDHLHATPNRGSN